MALELTLERDYRDYSCTMGMISNGVKSLHTIERPWRASDKIKGGLKGASCVPPGRYRLERHSSDNHPNVWALVNHVLDVYHWDADVPKHLRDETGQPIARTLVLIHSANWASELRGCIAPGTSRGKDVNGRRTYNSKDAVNQIRTWIGGSLDVYLTIKEEKLAA
jgi:hypothetical protein